jgi:hypothetical protein
MDGRKAKGNRYAVAIVERDPGWTPRNPLDTPDTGTIEEMAERGLKANEAITYARSYN